MDECQDAAQAEAHRQKQALRNAEVTHVRCCCLQPSASCQRAELTHSQSWRRLPGRCVLPSGRGGEIPGGGKDSSRAFLCSTEQLQNHRDAGCSDIREIGGSRRSAAPPQVHAPEMLELLHVHAHTQDLEAGLPPLTLPIQAERMQARVPPPGLMLMHDGLRSIASLSGSKWTSGRPEHTGVG